jgi:hypothetical protein
MSTSRVVFGAAALFALFGGDGGVGEVGSAGSPSGSSLNCPTWTALPAIFASPGHDRPQTGAEAFTQAHPLHRTGRCADHHLPAPCGVRQRDAIVRRETVDQTDQESRSADHGAATTVIAMQITIHASSLVTLATADLDGTFERVWAGGAGRPGADRAAVRRSQRRNPRSLGQPDRRQRAALSRPAIAMARCCCCRLAPPTSTTG